MGIFREIPPTAGLPLYIRESVPSLFKKGTYSGSLEDDFKTYLDLPYARVTCSGTAALYLILESLKVLSGKKTVVIPSFVCPLVALAIERAGLKVEVCDINPDNFNFDIQELKKICSAHNDILAVIAVHLGGIPQDIDAIKDIARNYRIFIIEDCAQSLGATYKGRKAGTLGDFAFFSLCRGKGLTIYEGGVVVTAKGEYGVIIEDKITELVRNRRLSEGLKILELFGYGIFYRPLFFWFVFRMPQIFWNWRGQRLRAAAEYFSPDFPVQGVSSLRKLIGHINFHHLDEETDSQREKADYYIERIKGIEGLKVVAEPAYARANYPYLAVIFDDPERQKRVLEMFTHTGLGVSQIYALPITYYAYLKGIVPERPIFNGRSIAQRQISLSTSTFLKRKDQDNIIDRIKNLS